MIQWLVYDEQAALILVSPGFDTVYPVYCLECIVCMTGSACVDMHAASLSCLVEQASVCAILKACDVPRAFAAVHIDVHLQALQVVIYNNDAETAEAPHTTLDWRTSAQ